MSERALGTVTDNELIDKVNAKGDPFIILNVTLDDGTRYSRIQNDDDVPFNTGDNVTIDYKLNANFRNILKISTTPSTTQTSKSTSSKTTGTKFSPKTSNKIALTATNPVP